MKKISLEDTAVAVVILGVVYAICIIIQNLFKTEDVIPSVYILGVFLISVLTNGYVYGIASSIISAVAVNFAFTFPYFKIDFTIQKNFCSAVIMIIIALITCSLTVKLKQIEAIKVESEKEKMRANLLRAVSHDLRTPLTTIYGASSALIENKNHLSEEKKDKMIKGIRDDAQWLSRLVENLLSITRLNNGDVKIIKTPTVLDELIDSVLVKFKKIYPDRTVDVDIPDDFITIPMDAILIEQVILNILENAAQHASGMTNLSLRVFLKSNKAIFEIRDNGCGIKEEKLKNIFTGGYAGDDEISDSNRSNAGIGLSVCATIINAHGGEIKAENLKEGGCVFRFMLEVDDII